MEIKSIINFLKEIEVFKTCERTCRTSDINRAESDAEHTWHLAVFLLMIEKEFKDVDFNKIIKISLIHDLPEIYAGDANPYRGNTEHKEENEKQAAERLFLNLPHEIRHEFQSLFDEYQRQETPEAKIVKAADKLMPLIQNSCTNHSYSSYRKLEVEYDEVKDYMDKYFKSDGILKSIYDRLLMNANNEGVFFDKNE